jgi:hypothetical protein
MTSPALLLAFAVALVGIATPLAPQRVADQIAPKPGGYVAPRTSWGEPDLEGIWPGTSMVRVPLERPRQYGTRLFMSAEEQQVLTKREEAEIARMARQGNGGQLGSPGDWVEWGTSQRQTSLLVDPPDGRLPALTADGEARLAKMPTGSAGYSPLNGPADFTPSERCLSRGVLGSTLPVLVNSGIAITQSPGIVVLRYEMIHEARVIPLDGRPHLSSVIAQYMGDGRGRWEGDTLVVDTTNSRDTIGLGVNGNGPPPSSALKLTERLTRVGRDTIRYEVTVNDPRTFVAPWTVTFPLTRMPDYVMAEYACHEGNRGLEFALRAARAEEAKGMGK